MTKVQCFFPHILEAHPLLLSSSLLMPFSPFPEARPLNRTFSLKIKLDVRYGKLPDSSSPPSLTTGPSGSLLSHFPLEDQ